ncbi:MAG TPA: ACT domain-containing protein [Candidatus Micrarchaeota archaeon]|nr:ACT domain-containing protein [Candidatus Micrarchaeota archaeon]
MEEITIVTENKVGILADVCELLGSNGINVEAISAQGLGGSGVIRVITGDVTSATRALDKAGVKYNQSEVLVVKVNDTPGELGKIARRIAKNSINIECMYLLSKNKGVMEVAIKTDNLPLARRALK